MQQLTPGPYDLSKFLGVKFGGEEHEAAIAKVLKAAKSAGKIAAIFCEWLVSVPLSPPNLHGYCSNKLHEIL